VSADSFSHKHSIAIKSSFVMILERHIHANNVDHRRTGRLFLNRVPVGSIIVRGHDGSWTFGDFTPEEGFSQFAPVFGRWSLLMHADGANERLSEAASEELRQTEFAIDSIRAMLLLDSSEEYRPLRQLNIDGPLIEWKE
jgi:hypothetical protein